MAIALVGQASDADFDTSLSTLYSSSAGNALVVCVLHQSRTSGISVTGGGNTFTLAATTIGTGASSQRLCSVYYCLDAAPVTAVTVSHASTTAFVVNVSEWSGVTSVVGGANSTDEDTPAAVSGILTDDLVVGMGAYFSSSGRLDSIQAPYTAMSASNISSTFGCFAFDLRDSDGASGPVWSGVPGQWGAVSVGLRGSPEGPNEGSASASVSFDTTATGKHLAHGQTSAAVQWDLTASGMAMGSGAVAGIGSAISPVSWATTATGVAPPDPFIIFSPPSHEEPMRTKQRPLRYFRLTWANSIVKRNGVYVAQRTLTEQEIRSLEAGVDYFIGGHEYRVSIPIAWELYAAGFLTEEPPAL